MKRCTRCHTLKPLSKFWKTPAFKSGRNNRCSDCCNELRLKKYRSDKEAGSKYGIGMGSIRIYGFDKAVKIYLRADKKCELCGENKKKLVIHHIDGKGYPLMRKGLRMNNDINNLQLLCTKCHNNLHLKDALSNRTDLWTDIEVEIIKDGMKNKTDNNVILNKLNNRTKQSLYRKQYLIRKEKA